MPPRAHLFVAVACAAFYALCFRLAPAGNPVLGSDSAGYLAIARWIGGVGQTPQQDGPAYAFGYGLLQVPGYLVTSDAATVYRVGVVLNILLGAMLAAALLHVLRPLTGARGAVAALAAFAGATYAGVALQVGQIWPEVLLALLVVAWAAAALAWAGTPRAGAGLALAAASVALLAVHGRMAGCVLVAAVLMRPRGLVPRGPRAVGLVALLAGAAAVLAADAAVRRGIFLPGASSSGLAGIRPGDAGSVLRTLLGQAWIVVAGSFGLAAAGAVVLAGGPPGPRRSAGRAVLAAFGLTALAGALHLVGSVATGTAPRVDYLAYGRYVDPWIPLLLAAGVAGLAQVRAAVVPVAAVGLAGLAMIGLHGRVLAGPTQSLNVLGVLGPNGLFFPPGSFGDGLHLAGVSLVALGGAAVLGLAGRRAGGVAVAGLAACAGVAGGVLGADRTLRGYQAFWERQDVELARAVAALPPAAPVAVDPAVESDTFHRLQLMLPERRFVRAPRAGAGYRVTTAQDAGSAGTRVLTRTQDGQALVARALPAPSP